MTSTTRQLMVGMMMTGLVGTGRPVVAASVDAPATGRVRSSNAVIGRVLKEASDQSRTFRRLVETINASDGTVYVEEGKCGSGVRACLATVTMAGANRYLWVKVDTRMADWDLMALIGHELQHAIEVLSDRTVTSGFAMYRFYLRQGSRINGLAAFETDAAIEAGDAVRTEVRNVQHGPIHKTGAARRPNLHRCQQLATPPSPPHESSRIPSLRLSSEKIRAERDSDARGAHRPWRKGSRRLKKVVPQRWPRHARDQAANT